MRTFELNIFIDRPCNEVYDHISEPINMIGLQPLLTTIDILKEQKDANQVVLRPFYMVETYRWLGLPIWRSRVYSVIHLTRPGQELELHVFRNPGINIVFRYFFNESDEGNRTHLIQRVSFEKVNKLMENFVFNQAITAQRALLTNLKVRLEKM
jgi:ligand-binding SRPBCC domain-containing protein